MIVDNFSEKLSKALKAKGWTARALADDAGLSESSLSRYLHGERIPRHATRIALATALKKPQNYFEK